MNPDFKNGVSYQIGDRVEKGGALFEATDKYVASPRKNQGWTQDQIGAALAALMTGPKATRPRWKTIKRAMRQIANKVAVRRISYYGRDASCK